jgi:hypothetical protein
MKEMETAAASGGLGLGLGSSSSSAHPQGGGLGGVGIVGGGGSNQNQWLSIFSEDPYQKGLYPFQDYYLLSFWLVRSEYQLWGNTLPTNQDSLSAFINICEVSRKTPTPNEMKGNEERKKERKMNNFSSSLSSFYLFISFIHSLLFLCFFSFHFHSQLFLFFLSLRPLSLK